MSGNEDECVGFALAKGWSDTRALKERLFEVGEGSQLWRGGQREKWKGASAVDDVNGILCVERECALVVVLGVLFRKADVVGACDGQS